jgi:glycosyltransferase involved in cell wall biosynthesis
LEIIGSGSLEPDYALACKAWLTRCDALASRVQLTGSLNPIDVVLRMQQSTLLISASLMESYGMALAEARTVGLPVLARRGGHVASLVSRETGGELVDSLAQLAGSLLQLCRNPAELSARTIVARVGALPARNWAAAARDFVDQVNVAMKPRANDTTTSAEPIPAAPTRQ